MMFSKRGTSAAEVQAATGDRVQYIKWITGRWYDCRGYLGGTASTAAFTANGLQSSPIWVPRAGQRVDRIAITVSTAAAASSIARLMLYLPDSNGLPGALLLDAGTVPVDTIGDKEITIDQTLPAGLIYGAVVSDGGPTLQVVTGSGLIAPYGAATATANPGGTAWRVNGGTTAPDPFGGSLGFVTNVVARIALRAA
jgi:hypothetical protein